MKNCRISFRKIKTAVKTSRSNFGQSIGDLFSNFEYTTIFKILRPSPIYSKEIKAIITYQYSPNTLDETLLTCNKKNMNKY